MAAESSDVGEDADERAAIRELEAAYLESLAAWDAHNRLMGQYCPRSDKFERRATAEEMPRARQGHKAKALTNRSVAAAAAEALRTAAAERRPPRALVLDGADATTAQALTVQGFPAGSVRIPNIIASVAEELRSKGYLAWAGRVEDYIERAPVPGPFQLVYLDHTGAFPRRAGQVRGLFERGWLGEGSALAVTFSTREGPWQQGGAGAEGGSNGAPRVRLPAGWSRSHAVYAFVRVLLDAAEAYGFCVQGADLDGLSDYVCDAGVGAAGGYSNAPEAPCSTAEGGPDFLLAGLESQLHGSLANGSIVGLTTLLAAWAGGVFKDATPTGDLGFFVRRAALLTGRVLPELGLAEPGLLGVAWAPPQCCEQAEPTLAQGKPHAILGLAGAPKDGDVLALRTLATQVLEATRSLRDTEAARHTSLDRAEDAGPLESRGPEDGSPTRLLRLRRCLLLYPEQMMFLVVKLRRRGPTGAGGAGGGAGAGSSRSAAGQGEGEAAAGEEEGSPSRGSGGAGAGTGAG